MDNKPTSITNLLKEKGKEKPAAVPVPKYPGITTSNRFALLAAKNVGGRERSLSKRSRMDSVEEDDERYEEVSESELFINMEKVETQLKDAKSIIEQVKKDSEKIPDDSPVAAVVRGLAKWMEVTTSIQENTVSAMLDEKAKLAKKVSLIEKAVPASLPSGKEGHRSSGQRKENEDGEDPRKKKFVQAVREAERSTLIFNTDMGNVSIMNTNTMNRKFSMALKDMAAAVDGNANGEPKADTVTQLDDTLSMVKNMEYFGKATKKAAKKDFFTIPVKLTYKDKDTRASAESNLRKLCKVSCTTPYHSTLRDVIKKVVEDCKQKLGKGFVQTRIDTEKMCIKVSYNDNGVWHNDVEVVPLPDSVYDTSNKVSRVPKAKEAMEVDAGESVQG
jgi:hypothetical protein